MDVLLELQEAREAAAAREATREEAIEADRQRAAAWQACHLAAYSDDHDAGEEAYRRLAMMLGERAKWLPGISAEIERLAEPGWREQLLGEELLTAAADPATPPGAIAQRLAECRAAGVHPEVGDVRYFIEHFPETEGKPVKVARRAPAAVAEPEAPAPETANKLPPPSRRYPYALDEYAVQKTGRTGTARADYEARYVWLREHGWPDGLLREEYKLQPFERHYNYARQGRSAVGESRPAPAAAVEVTTTTAEEPERAAEEFRELSPTELRARRLESLRDLVSELYVCRTADRARLLNKCRKVLEGLGEQPADIDRLLGDEAEISLLAYVNERLD